MVKIPRWSTTNEITSIYGFRLLSCLGRPEHLYNPFEKSNLKIRDETSLKSYKVTLVESIKVCLFGVRVLVSSTPFTMFPHRELSGRILIVPENNLTGKF